MKTLHQLDRVCAKKNGDSYLESKSKLNNIKNILYIVYTLPSLQWCKKVLYNIYKWNTS